LYVQAKPAADKILLAMRIAVEHMAVSTDPKVLCAAARTCKGWREAVQQCGACNTVVVLSHKNTLQQLDSLAEWLVNHAGLVRSITASKAELERSMKWSTPFYIVRDHLAEVQQLLQHALQAAAAATAVDDTAGQGALAVTPQQQLQRWRLAGFSCDLTGATAMLAALPAHSLTHLHLECS
jgi:hypothetical protein